MKSFKLSLRLHEVWIFSARLAYPPSCSRSKLLSCWPCTFRSLQMRLFLCTSRILKLYSAINANCRLMNLEHSLIQLSWRSRSSIDVSRSRSSRWCSTRLKTYLSKWSKKISEKSQSVSLQQNLTTRWRSLSGYRTSLSLPRKFKTNER